MEARSRISARGCRDPDFSGTCDSGAELEVSASLPFCGCCALVDIPSYHDALKYNIKLGNRNAALLWGEKQLQHELICLGDDHPDYQETLEMVDHLRIVSTRDSLPISDLFMDWVDLGRAKESVSWAGLLAMGLGGAAKWLRGLFS
jgi:hypothetical protein